jgi:hypothetical protein
MGIIALMFSSIRATPRPNEEVFHCFRWLRSEPAVVGAYSFCRPGGVSDTTMIVADLKAFFAPGAGRPGNGVSV